MTERAFPARVAAVDIGSNALRFTAAEFLDRTRRAELADQRVPVRLGHAAFLTGRLTPENVDRAVEAMTGFRRTMDALEVTAYRAVATSAVRESGNGHVLAERARWETGLELEIISGAEEARLVAVATGSRVSLEGRWLLVDLGGGSLEVSIVRDSGIEWTDSRPLGTVRLLESLPDEGQGDGAERDVQLRRLVDERSGTLRVPSLEGDGLRGLIATGGNIEALAKLAGADRDGNGVSRLPLTGLRAMKKRLAELSYRERVDGLDLREDRADVIVPAAHVYEWVAERAGATELVVPHVGVKEGILLDLAGGDGGGARLEEESE